MYLNVYKNTLFFWFKSADSLKLSNLIFCDFFVCLSQESICVAGVAVLAFLWNRHMELPHKHTTKAVLISICTLAKKSPSKSFPIKRQRISLFRCCYIQMSLHQKLYRVIQYYTQPHFLNFLFPFQSSQVGIAVIVSCEFSDGA